MSRGSSPALSVVDALDRVEVTRWVDRDAASSARVTRVDHDSREVSAGSLFCCIPGAAVDGHDFAPQAIERGAVGLVVERALDLGTAPAPVPQAVVGSVREAIGPTASRVAGDPSRAVSVVGVTGTNGKTTVTHLLGAVLERAGRSTAVVGTLSGARTTPEAPELQARLAEARDDGAEAVAMEVSSHALDMHRVDGTWFEVAVFTNLSRDHLDHHGTMEAYFRAKARLFRPDFTARAVVNLDDVHGRLLHDAAEVDTVGYTIGDLDGLEVGVAGSSFRWRGHGVRLPLGGRFNVSNALAAAETAVLLGLEPAVVAEALSAPVSIPGRFERVAAGQDFDVVVDFAHTPDGLDHLLDAAGVGPGRVIVVFGCGGDRDASKRAPMGSVAARRADVVLLTADNSRSEETGVIIEAIRAGALEVDEPRVRDLRVEPDRRVAIRAALVEARPGDVVVVAGKGHESTQTIGDRTVPFDDRQVVVEELRRIGSSRPGVGA